MSHSTNLEYRARELTENKRKKAAGQRSSTRKKGNKDLERERKQQRRPFLIGRTTWKFLSHGDKMRNARATNAMGGSEKKWSRRRTTFPPKNVQLRSSWKFHVVVVQNNGKEMYKKMCCTCKVAFLLIRPIVFFYRSPAMPSPPRITRFYTLFEQTRNKL